MSILDDMATAVSEPAGSEAPSRTAAAIALDDSYAAHNYSPLPVVATTAEGAWITDDRKVALPPRHELATSMEALIHHFKLVTEGYRVPPGEVYFPIEGPRGEYGCFVRSDGSAKPARVHMRDPSFVNLQATADMVRGSYIADFIATLAMMDPVLGGIDR